MTRPRRQLAVYESRPPLPSPPLAWYGPSLQVQVNTMRPSPFINIFVATKFVASNRFSVTAFLVGAKKSQVQVRPCVWRPHFVMDSLCFIVRGQLWYRLSVSLTSDWCQVARLVIDAASTALRQNSIGKQICRHWASIV